MISKFMTFWILASMVPLVSAQELTKETREANLFSVKSAKVFVPEKTGFITTVKLQLELAGVPCGDEDSVSVQVQPISGDDLGNKVMLLRVYKTEVPSFHGVPEECREDRTVQTYLHAAFDPEISKKTTWSFITVDTGRFIGNALDGLMNTYDLKPKAQFLVEATGESLDHIRFTVSKPAQ